MDMRRRLLAGLAAAILIGSMTATSGAAWADGSKAPAASLAGKSTGSVPTISQEEAIRRARQRLHIFPTLSWASASLEQHGGAEPTWTIFFTTPAQQPTPLCAVEMRATDGEILTYNLYTSFGLPGVGPFTRAEGLASISAFFAALQPPHLESMVLSEETAGGGNGDERTATFTYRRMQSGVPVVRGSSDEGMTLAVTRLNSEIVSYRYNWTEQVQFAKAKPTLDLRAALAAYRKELGWELSYHRVGDPSELPRYVLGYSEAHQFPASLNAVTGKPWNPYGALGSPTLAPIPVATPLQGLRLPVSKSSAEKRARQLLRLSDGMRAQSISKVGKGDGQVWLVMFQQQIAGKVRYAWAKVRVRDGLVTSLGQNEPGVITTSGKPELTAAVVAPRASAMLTSALGEEAANWRPVVNPAQPHESGVAQFTYQFMHDGVPVEGYQMSVQVSATTGQVLGLAGNLPESDLHFSSAKQILTADAAFDAWTKVIGLELVYRVEPRAPGSRESVGTLYWQPPSRGQGGFVAADTLQVLDSQGHGAR